METGWLGTEPDEAPAAGGFAGFILANRAADTGRTVEQVLARAALARDREPDPVDPDDRMAAMVTRGYQPGMLRRLSEQLGDTQAELEAERDKLEKAAKRAKFAAREHAAGRVDAFRMLAMMDGDDGDESRIAMLERRVQSLGRQLADAQNLISPPQARDVDAVEQASRAAHEVFREVTRARWAEAQGGSRPRRGRPPFDSASRGDTEHTGPDCQVCAAARERDAARAREDFVAVYGEITR